MPNKQAYMGAKWCGPQGRASPLARLLSMKLLSKYRTVSSNVGFSPATWSVFFHGVSIIVYVVDGFVHDSSFDPGCLIFIEVREADVVFISRGIDTSFRVRILLDVKEVVNEDADLVTNIRVLRDGRRTS